MHLLRTRFKQDIVTEFLPPARESNQVVILCDGMPTVPNKKTVLEYLSSKNYWVFHPRYRGTWESGGEFLKRSPHEDILDVVHSLSRSFKSLWDGKRFKIEKPEIYIVGSSFGGAAGLLASIDPKVSKVFALSPVVDWRRESKAEPLDHLKKQVRQSFGQAYRFQIKNWSNLTKPHFFNPMDEMSIIDGKKIHILHTRDDDIVDWKGVRMFSKSTKARLSLWKKGGHFSSSALLTHRIFKKFQRFVHKR